MGTTTVEIRQLADNSGGSSIAPLTVAEAVFLNENVTLNKLVGNLDIDELNNNTLALTNSLTYKGVYNAIRYVGTSSTNSMIRFLDNSLNGDGSGISIGGGGATILGGGESALTMESALDRNDREVLYLCNDGQIDFYTNCQNGTDSAAHTWIDTTGKIHAKNFIITDSAPSNSVLLGNGIILKYGSVGGSGAANQRVNFPVAFPSTCLFVLLGTSGIGPVLRLYGSYVTSSGWDKSGFYASIIAVDKDQTYYSTGAISYIAIGY